METKTIVLGSGAQVKTELKPIVVKAYLTGLSEINHDAAHHQPSSFRYIELIALGYSPGVDIMFAYNDPEKRKSGVLLIGHWNDGIV